MTIGCNIWMICLKLNGFFYGLSRMLQFSQFVWTPCYSVWDVFNHFLLIDATDRSKISSDQKRFFIALSLYPLSFFEDSIGYSRNIDNFYNSHNSFLWPNYFIDFICERCIPCHAVISFLCLLHSPELQYTSVKKKRTTCEITIFTL